MARTTIQGSFLGLASQAAGDVMYFNGTNWIRLAKGSADEVLTMNNGATAPEWEAGGGGATTREGGNTDGSGSYQTNSIEATTTSTSDVDLLPVSDLSIAATSPINYLLNIRKTAGAVGQAWVGLKLNTTVVQEGAGNYSFQSTNRQESGSQVGWIGARIGSDYLRPALIITTSTNGWNQLTPGDGISTFRAANTPTVTITDFVIMGKSGSANLTLGVDELHIYSLAVS